MKRLLWMIVLALLMVLGYALFQRHQQPRSRLDLTAEERLATVCVAYEDVRALAQIDTVTGKGKALHSAADTLCRVLTTDSALKKK